MKITNDLLINELITHTKANLNAAQELAQQSIAPLNQRPEEGAWSALEAIEHLNRYGDFYLPEIRKRLASAQTVNSNHEFKGSWLGNYFAESMKPKEQLNKMNAFKNMNPAGSSLDHKTLERFINQQKAMLEILEQCRKVNMSRTKTSITISNLIKLRLGNTLQVIIYHNDRHIIQANNAAGLA